MTPAPERVQDSAYRLLKTRAATIMSQSGLFLSGRFSTEPVIARVEGLGSAHGPGRVKNDDFNFRRKAVINRTG